MSRSVQDAQSSSIDGAAVDGAKMKELICCQIVVRLRS